MKEGIEKGIEKGQEEVIHKLLAKGLSPEQLAELLDMPADELGKVKPLNQNGG